MAAIAASMVPLWPAEAWAQAGQTAEEGSGGSYTISYLVVVFLVGLGLTVVLRSAGRSTDVKQRRED